MPSVLQLNLNNNKNKNFLDISIFIGAQSPLNQSKWFWKNGSAVNNSMFRSSNKSLCQQMTWPLIYDDGINLHEKTCNEEAYFLCRFKCKCG